jgi:hypothetical protein
MNAVIVQDGWFTSLVDDCRAIMTEAVFASRWALIEGYHQLGERIVTDSNYQRYARDRRYVQELADTLGVSPRTVYYAIAFYVQYPSLNTVPEGKNISWNKLITKYLTAPKDEGGLGDMDKDQALAGIAKAIDRHNVRDVRQYFEVLGIEQDPLLHDWARSGFLSMEEFLKVRVRSAARKAVGQKGD